MEVRHGEVGTPSLPTFTAQCWAQNTCSGRPGSAQILALLVPGDAAMGRLPLGEALVTSNSPGSPSLPVPTLQNLLWPKGAASCPGFTPPGGGFLLATGDTGSLLLAADLGLWGQHHLEFASLLTYSG